MAAAVAVKGQSQLRRLTDESLEMVDELFGEDIVMPMVKIRVFLAKKIHKLYDHRGADGLTRLLLAQGIKPMIEDEYCFISGEARGCSLSAGHQ